MKLLPLEGKENSNLYRHPKTGIIYFKMFRQGKGQLEKSTKTTVPKDARKKKDELLQEWLGLKPKTNIVKLMEDLWKEFLDTKGDKAFGTIASIENSGKHLMPFFGSWFPADVTSEAWEKYISVKRKHQPDRKFFNDWKWFNMFLLYLRENRYIDRRPKLRNPDPKRSEAGKIFTQDEIDRLLSNANIDLRLQILMGYTMGMRVGEILNLTWDRIDIEKRTIHLRAQDTKIRRARSFRSSQEVFELLGARFNKNGPLFPSPKDPTKAVGKGGNKSSWRTCKDVSKVVGRFHDLRHSFLTRAFKSSKGRVDLMLICEYAGLSIEQAQQTYLHFTHEDTGVVAELVPSNIAREQIGE